MAIKLAPFCPGLQQSRKKKERLRMPRVASSDHDQNIRTTDIRSSDLLRTELSTRSHPATCAYRLCCTEVKTSASSLESPDVYDVMRYWTDIRRCTCTLSSIRPHTGSPREARSRAKHLCCIAVDCCGGSKDPCYLRSCVDARKATKHLNAAEYSCHTSNTDRNAVPVQQ